MERENSPSPEDLAPDHPELQESNDEFLERISDRLDTPYTWEERVAQYNAQREMNQFRRAAEKEQEQKMLDSRPSKAEDYTKTLDAIDQEMEHRVALEQIAQLDPVAQEKFYETDAMLDHIARLMLQKRKSRSLNEFVNEAKLAWNNLCMKFPQFKSGDVTPQEFSALIQQTYQQISELDRLISELPE